MFPHLACDRGDRHDLDHRHEQGFKEERESASFPCPGNFHAFDAALPAPDPRNTSMKVGFMLEEIEMPPT